MGTYELLFRVGDSPGPMELGHWKDGMIIAYKRLGEEFTSAELNTWLGTYGTGVLGAAPNGFDTLPGEKQAQWRRRMGQLNYLLHPAIQSENPAALEQLRALRYPEGYDNEDERLAQIGDIAAKARDAGRTKTRVVAHGGFDTNWGFNDLMKFGVVCVSLTYAQVQNANEGATDETISPMRKRRVWARSTYRVKYEAFMTPARVLRVRDTEDLVPVQRGSIYTAAQALEKIIRV